MTTLNSTENNSFLVNSCSLGIEPLHSLGCAQEESNTCYYELNPCVEKILKVRELYSKQLVKDLTSNDLKNFKIFPEDLKKLFMTTFDIDPLCQVRMQAVFQKQVEHIVITPIYLPMITTKESIKKIYLLAYKLGCKQVTLLKK